MRIDVTNTWTKAFWAVALVGVAGFVVGCADTAVNDGAAQSNDSETQEAALEVTPEFRVAGTAQVPEALRLDELGFNIAYIKLIPTDGGEPTKVEDPFEVSFDLAEGQQVERATSFTVPNADRYAVELRLEPTGTGTQSDHTFRLNGRVSPEIAEALNTNPHEDGGDPIPDPFHPDDDETAESAGGTNWVAFEYLSEKAVTYRLDSVELGPQRRVLSFELNINDWAQELIEPIAELARVHAEDAETAQEQTDVSQTVDVTRTLDSTGRGYEFLADDVRVRAVQMDDAGSTP